MVTVHRWDSDEQAKDQALAMSETMIHELAG